MQKCNSEDLREKEVINTCDGRRLGCVSEVEFNVCDGRLTAIVVPVSSGFLGVGSKERLCIPWDRIERIGEDVILVNVEGLPTSSNKKDRRPPPSQPPCC